MNKLISSAAMAVVLSGCASLEKWEQASELEVQQQITQMDVQDSETESPQQPTTVAGASVEFQQNYRQQLLNNMGNVYNRRKDTGQSVKNINYYARGIMQELVGNLQYVNASTPMAVTSFVFLDSDFNKAEIVGKQLSESFVHEVHKFGIPVIDFKTTDYIRVADDGDFVLSKDYLDLSGDLPIRYVLTGTLVKHLAGYMVNARIVGIQSKAVVASAQGFLPSSVINSLVSSNVNDGIPLTLDTSASER